MAKTTMLKLLEDKSNTVKDYWEKDENGLFDMKADKKNLYADIIVELMDKAIFGDEMKNHTQEEMASHIHMAASTFSKFINMSTNIGKENLKKIVDAILICLCTEGNLADDAMKGHVGELLFCIFRRKEVTEIVEHFKVQSEDNREYMDEKHARGYSHVLQVENLFGNPEQIQDDISYEDYFIDSSIIEEEMQSYIYNDIIFNDYEIEADSKNHIVIFDVKRIGKEFLHQRIRCLQRKENVFAILMVERGVCYDEIDFYQDEHSNIMLIEYKEVRKENSETLSYEYLRGICLSWYDEKCKEFMTEGINKIFVSHK